MGDNHSGFFSYKNWLNILRRNKLCQLLNSCPVSQRGEIKLNSLTERNRNNFYFFYKILPFYAKNLLLQRNIELRHNASGLASYCNSNNFNCFLGEKPNTVCFGACKLWLILFGIFLLPTGVFRWAGLELKDTIFKCKERFFCVLKLHQFLFQAHLPDVCCGEKTHL